MSDLLDVPELVVPVGPYCYENLGPLYSDGRPGFKIRKCPFWEFRIRRGQVDEDGHRFDYEYGVCHLLQEEDCCFLWDQCKICNVNLDLDDRFVPAQNLY